MNTTLLKVLFTAAAAVAAFDFCHASGPQGMLAGFCERTSLWPEGLMPDAQPHQIAAVTEVSRAEGFEPDEWRRPYLEWRAPDSGVTNSRSCMILISGGGYEFLCDAAAVARWSDAFTKLGVTCVNLVHRTPRPKNLPFYKSAWEDGQRAVRIVRSQAAARGFDPERIGVMAVSAGAHLATLLATSSQTRAYEPVDALDADVPCHVNWACPFALAFALTDGIGATNSRDGDAADVMLDPLFAFDAKTPPMCLMHGGRDIYSPLASTRVYRRLREMKIPAEVHLHSDKPHGAFGFDRAVEFMRQMGFLAPLEPETNIRWDFPDNAVDASCRTMLWPDGKTPDRQNGQGEPWIEWHMPEKLKTRAVQIVFSGGGYKRCNHLSYEVTPVRKRLNDEGMAVVVLKYRAPRPAAPLEKHLTAWQDLQRAIRLVRRDAPGRGLDPNRIGIMGSSAGGHLALLGATSSRRKTYRPVDDVDKLPCNVQWAVAFYPAYVLTDGADGPNSCGGNPDDARIVSDFSFDPDTCPVLFIHGDADGYSAMGSVKVWEQLRRMGIQGEVHTLATRGHCFQGKSSPGTGSRTCLDRILEFIGRKGFNAP